MNPDNPTGNYISQQGIKELVQWAKEKKITLILDESFADFSDEKDNTMIKQKILEENPHLVLIKSISKAHGIPGARLGVLASGNKAIIDFMKKEAAIWNINSFGEFYMQIAEKYKKDFAVSLDKLREVRNKFQKLLEEIEGIKVLSSQANYFMVMLPQAVASTDLVKRMLIQHDILIKDLSKKTGNTRFIRIAIRRDEENMRFVAALREELENNNIDC